jgi:hypothetical protein
LRYFAASALVPARAFAASDILFRVAAEIILFFAGAAAFTLRGSAWAAAS